jgi:hypothetical protein
LHCKKTKGNKKHQVFHRCDVAKLNEIRKDNLHGFSRAFAMQKAVSLKLFTMLPSRFTISRASEHRLPLL